jgi:hypothetical protein
MTAKQSKNFVHAVAAAAIARTPRRRRTISTANSLD